MGRFQFLTPIPSAKLYDAAVKSRFFVSLQILVLVASASFAQTCLWGAAQEIGVLAEPALREVSGLATSALVPGRLYSVSDSGSPYFYVSDLQGAGLQQVRIGSLGNYARDLEDLAVGPCGGVSCLVVGNIGGNNSSRDRVEVIAVEEPSQVPERVTPRYRHSLVYPDGPHYAEGLAVHPNGDLYILSKETVSPFGTAAARLYRVRSAAWQTETADPLPLRLVATLDLRALSGSAFDLLSHMATSLDIAPDGSRFLVLTYNAAFEVSLDLSTLPDAPITHLRADSSFERINVERLAQQEAVTYLRDGSRFIYTTESRRGGSPLFEAQCGE
ncbi:hypothetical protein BH24DEI2_BH24DEI2_00940 [soil metagenome]